MTLKQVLRRFDVFIFRDLSAGDRRQVPAAARIDFYEQGATVNIASAHTLTPSEQWVCDVWNTGAIQIGDDVLVGPSGPTLHVVKVILLEDVSGSMVPVNKLKLENLGGSGVTVSNGDRLLRVNDRPIAQPDPTGAATAGNPYVETDPSTGRAFCYLRPLRFDAVLSGNGLATRVFPDCDGSFVIRT